MIQFDVILPTIGLASVFEAIDSVNKQDYPYWTLWVICDGIKQLIGPNNIHAAITPLNGQIIGSPFQRHEDSGAWARNEGLRLGNASWITYIDDDDEWLPHHLSTLARLIEDNPGVDMVRTAGQSFMMKHRSPRSSKLVRKMGAVNSTDILTVGMAHTRGIFNKTQGWQPCDNHDHLLWKEMLAAGGKAVESNEVTFHYRR